MARCPTGTGNSKICGFADDTLTENANTAAAILSEFVSLDIYSLLISRPPLSRPCTHCDGCGVEEMLVAADQLSLLSIIMLGLGGGKTWLLIRHCFMII